jgi:decaprenyl-phosphate phosphoribosyltransferase
MTATGSQAARSPAGRARALLTAARPHQWVKNLLVFSVPAAAGELDNGTVLVETLLAFAAFCFVASGTYLLNDASDVDADRLHPVKRRRPVATGQLSVRTAVIAGIALLVAGCLVALAVAPELFAVVGGYVALTTVYTRWLKNVPVFDIAAVAAGFFLRAVAGGVPQDLYISRWFLIVAGAGSLFLVTGKRYAELRGGGAAAAQRRAALEGYTPEYLRALLSTTAAVTVLAYCLWAFEGSPAQEPSNWTELSAVPFVLGVMRYGLLLEQGHGEEPEQVIFGDRSLILVGIAWLALLAAGVAG